LAVDQDIARGMRGSLEHLVRDAEVFADLAELGGAAETLRAEFEEKAVASDGVDDAAGAGRGFKELNFDAGFLEGVGADEAGDATADDQRLNRRVHRRKRPRFTLD
jgi:hypothetical protein